MFSINLSHRVIVDAVLHLYIPLCFLLIVKGGLGALAAGVLYIPLCFLLIYKARAAAKELTGDFTFHYVFY